MIKYINMILFFIVIAAILLIVGVQKDAEPDIIAYGTGSVAGPFVPNGSLLLEGGVNFLVLEGGTNKIDLE